jgi:hypothetical protein
MIVVGHLVHSNPIIATASPEAGCDSGQVESSSGDRTESV